jgi:hypothetical protein
MENKDVDITQYSYYDDEIMIVPGASLLVNFEPRREKTVMGIYHAGNASHRIVFWGENNALPEEREYIIGNNNIVPQIIRTKRDLIIGGGMMAYTERYEKKDGKMVRVIDEVEMPTEFSEWLEMQDEYYGGVEELCNDLLKHGNYYVEGGLRGDEKPAFLKPHAARCVRAQKQDRSGRIPMYFTYGGWSRVANQQRLDEVKQMGRVPAYNPMSKDLQPKFMMHGADKLMGGPYYYDPHYAGSSIWIKVANAIPLFHLSNMENGFNIRYLIKVPEDYFIRSLSEDKRKDTEKLRNHVREAKLIFKNKLNEFLAGMKNAGRGLIVTKHIYKGIQKEWPELEIVPLEVDLKDEAMIKLFESSNQANTSAHGIPPILAGLATGAKMTSGSEVRNLYNFWQISAAPIPRGILLRPYRWAWRQMGLPTELKLGFRNTELTTTDKNPTGIQEPQSEEENAV